jgi:3-phenylpropionate/trans-cinnamate dioxygenase ferredoxin reductase subunit
MEAPPRHVLVVGAGLGGLRTAEQLREAGFDGSITLIGDEPGAPYDRPPLSKQILTGEWEPETAELRSLSGLESLSIRARLGTRAARVRPGEVLLASGESLHGDAVVVATGAASRSLPGQSDHVLTLRTISDSVALRDALGAASSLLVIGGGFIGAEVASAARKRGVAVTVIEALPVPFARALGREAGALAGRLIREGGADLRLKARISRFLDAGDQVAVQLEDGNAVAADIAVTAIGAVPRTECLNVTGTSAGGIPCGPTGRVHGLAGVWAVGDAAAWEDPRQGGRFRHEHWTSAVDQAAAVALDILGRPAGDRPVPYFWSDQFGLKIQVIGRPELADEVIPLRGDGLDGGPVRGTVIGYAARGRLVAVAGFGAARAVAQSRALVANGASTAETLAASA